MWRESVRLIPSDNFSEPHAKGNQPHVRKIRRNDTDVESRTLSLHICEKRLPGSAG